LVIIQVIYADEFVNADYNQMIDKIFEQIREYDMSFEGHSRIFSDGKNPEVIGSIKGMIDENLNYLEAIKVIKSNTPGQNEEKAVVSNMLVCPVYFAKYHKEMLAHCKELLEYRNGYISINPRFNKLITSLPGA
jgi:hypothetical protein